MHRSREYLSKRTREGLERAKQQGKHIGRPHHFTVGEIRDILTKLDLGNSYRAIASEYGVSHTTIAKIKKEGLTRCDSIDRQCGIQKKLVNTEEAEVLLNLNLYTQCLKTLLKEKHGIKLTVNACYQLVKEMLGSKLEDRHHNPYEYTPPTSYIELTSHVMRLRGN